MLARTGLWRDVEELTESLARTLDARDGVSEVAGLLGTGEVSRVVASGNGAAYYAALALWLASLEGTAGPEVLAVPAGLLARGGFRWRPGDALLAVSSSGELRDLVEAIDEGGPKLVCAITSTPGSPIASRARARVLVTVLEQRAVTHTQAFCGNVAAALAVWAEISADSGLTEALTTLPDVVQRSVAAATGWVESLPELDPPAAIAFGSGPAWAAALETALLLKEVAGVSAEGVETREGATSAMMALAPGQLAVALTTGPDPLLEEAACICAARGATVVRTPDTGADRRLAAITTFAPAAALSASLGLRRGLDVDHPAWTEDYYRVARPA